MTFQFTPGQSPLLISVPHAGTGLLPELESRLTDQALSLGDTDWHVHRLVESATDLGTGVIHAEMSRYVVDLNRPPDDRPLYDQAGTGLVPIETFDGRPLYRSGQGPDGSEVEQRVRQFWRPYHDRLAAELERLRADHGFAVLFDAHSITSRVPRLFEGRLPDLNLGTYGSRSCAGDLEQRVAGQLASATGFSHVVNGRFQGGFITRHYGRPDQGVHALQLEIAQACYMDESNPESWDEQRAGSLKNLLGAIFESITRWRPS